MAIKKFNTIAGLSVGELASIDVIDDTGNVTANNLSVNRESNLGNVANVHITGGTNSFLLQTDGSGNLSWVAPSSGGSIGGSNTQIQFNDDGIYGADSNLTFDKANARLFAENIQSNSITVTGGIVIDSNLSLLSSNLILYGGLPGQLLTTDGTGNLSFTSLSINPAGSNTEIQFNNNGYFGNNANFTFNADTLTLAVDNVVATTFTGDAGNLSNITGGNITGTVYSAYLATYATTANSVSSANIVGTVALAEQVTSSSQPNITSLGTLDSLNITGDLGVISNITAGNADLGNVALANFFIGNGVGLTYIEAANVIGTVANANYAVWALNTINSGNANAANTANSANAVTGSSQPNITSLGNLTQLVVSGSVDMGNANAGNVIANSLISNSSLIVRGDASISGNLIVYGNSIYADVSSLRVTDPIIEQGGVANGDPLPSNDGMDRGQILHYFNDVTMNAPVDAFMGWDNSNLEFAFSSNASVVDNIVTFHELGNVRAAYFIGSGANLTDINAANIGEVANANYSSHAGTVTASAQPNITSVGTLTALDVIGNVTAGNANLGNAAVANFFIGSGANLFDINGANILGTVANANYAAYAGNITITAQPNITSVGNLTTLTVEGNITSNNANLGNAVSANFFIGSGANLFDINSANILGTVANANYAAYAGIADQANIALTVTASNQPNISNVGSLDNLTVIGNSLLGNAATANFFIGSGANLFDINGANVSEVANANYATYADTATIASTVTACNQPNITSIGTLGNLTVTNNANIGNISTTGEITSSGNITAPWFLGNIIGNISGNITTPGANTDIIFNNQGFLGASSSLTFDIDTNTVAVNGNITSNILIANYLRGDGSNLSSIEGANVVGAVATAGYATTSNIANSALLAGSVTTNAQANITSVGTLTSLTVSGTTTLGNAVTANFFIGSGANLTNINGANVSEVANAIYATNASSADIATVAGTVTTNAQPNITSVGTLSSANISGNLVTSNATVNVELLVSGNATITGNLTVNGSVEYINSSSLYIEDPIIEQGGGANGDALSSNDGKDRGSILHYYSGQPIDAFMGWDNSNAEFAFASNASVTSDVVTISTFGNVRAEYFIGNVIGNLNGNITIPGSNTQLLFNNDSNLGTSANLTFNNSTNILLVNGNISAGNVAASTFTGNLIGNATTAGTVISSSQPNITHVGVLSDLAVDGNVTANWFIGNIVGNVSGNFVVPGSNRTLIYNADGNAGASDALTFNSDSNVLTISGNVTANVITANYFIGSGATLSSINGANVSQVANANFATYSSTASTADTTTNVTASSQPNITSVGTLVSLDVAGNISGGNASLDNMVTAAYFSGNGYYLNHINSANITGTVANANYATYSGTAAAANTVAGANVSGTVANANYAAYAGNITHSNQPNITTVGTLGNLVVSGNITANNISAITDLTVGNLIVALAFSGDGSQLTNVSASNSLTASSASTITSSSQPNITSVGSLVDLTVIGNIYSGNAHLGNYAVANFIAGNGAYLTSLTGSAVTGVVANANYAAYAGNANVANTALYASTADQANVAITVTSSSQPNITSVGSLVDLTVIGNVDASNGYFGNRVSAAYFVGDGANLSYIQGGNVEGFVANATYANTANNASNAQVANIANTVVSSSQPNITSVGTLTTLTVSGDTTLANLIATNITIGNIVLEASNITADNFIGNFTGNLSGNIAAPGTDTSVIFNNAGNIGSSAAFKFDSSSNIVTILGNLSVANVITRDSKVVHTFVSSDTMPTNPQKGDEWYDEVSDKIYKYVYDGTTYAWIDITSGFISANAASEASTLVLRDANGSITANIFYGNGINVTGVSNLGTVGNLYITGGSSSYLLQTDGLGNLSWVAPTSGGGISGSNTQLQFNDAGTFGSNANLTFNKTTNLLSVPYANLTLTSAASSQPNITSIGTLFDVTISNAASITNVIANNIISRNANIAVSTDTVIDTFTIGSYRTAKYTIKAGSDDGYQSVEVLLVHNDSSSYVTIYGSISTIADDIITLTSNIVSGNVKLYASSASANTKVKLIGTYVTD